MSHPQCIDCKSLYTYDDGEYFHCPECGAQWSMTPSETSDDLFEVRDSNGTLLQDGDNVTVIKDLKVKGSSAPLKMGTKVKNIRLVDEDHNIDCKIDGFGAMKLKSEYVKKL